MIHILDLPDVDGVRVERDVDESKLVKLEGATDNEHEYTTWVEYRFPGSDVIVHRSCHVTIKEGLEAQGRAQYFDVDRWARDLVDGLKKQRRETGKPVELKGMFTAQELAAVRRVFAADQALGGIIQAGS
jgi:hypothetical protein